MKIYTFYTHDSDGNDFVRAFSSLEKREAFIEDYIRSCQGIIADEGLESRTAYRESQGCVFAPGSDISFEWLNFEDDLDPKEF